MTDRQDARREFVLSSGIYLLSHSVGLPPKNTPDYVTSRYLDPWASHTADVWSDWLDRITVFRKELAGLFNSRFEFFCPQPNVSSALTKILSSLKFPKGRVLLSEKAFPSLGFILLQSNQLQPCFIPGSKTITDIRTWDESLTDDIGCVLITHVHSNTNERSPVKEIVDLAKSRGIVSVVDVAQSAGVVPIDVEDWGADFVIGSCVKWLCGGPGAGYLWVNPNTLEVCQPTDVGWFSHEAPFEFDIHNFRYAPDALRFWGGTPDVVPFVIATNSIRLIRSLGVESVQEHNQDLVRTMIKALPNGAELISPENPDLRGGTLVVSFGPKHDRFGRLLQEAGVQFDNRPTGVRLSPHIYNTHAEIQQVVGIWAA